MNKLDEGKMSPIQNQETKRAFFGGLGMMLVLMRDDIADMTQDEAVQGMEDLQKQIVGFWND